MSKYLVVSREIYPESKETLLKMGFELIIMPSQKCMEKPVSSHPDMFMTRLDNTIFCDDQVNNLFTSLDDKNSITICNRGVSPRQLLNYPSNILFNCVNVGDKLICNKKYTCSDIIKCAEKYGIKILNVKQGYAKCSTCVISDNAIITEDESIAHCAAENGIDVLKIQKGHVKLDGYDYGFIGGCSGQIEKNLVAFNGNIFIHPEIDKINKFCSKYSVEIISLCDRELYDIGSIIRI